MSKQNSKKKGDSLGLGALGDLGGLMDDQTPESKGLLEIALKDIDEDPNQPRKDGNPGFSKESIAELAVTIKDRGVKSPISVRVNLEDPQRYIINHGARRYRASKVAGKKTIPAFIDNDYLEVDQVVENLQRNKLTAREIADYVGRQLAAGIKKGAIAESLGKSNAFVSQHAALLDLPETIAQVFNAERTSDVTTINELCKAYKQDAEQVEIWLSDEEQEITRSSVKLLRDFMDDKKSNVEVITTNNENTGTSDEEQEPKKTPKQPQDPEIIKKAIVMVKHQGNNARIILNKRPSAEGNIWIKYSESGEELDVAVTSVRLHSLIEG